MQKSAAGLAAVLAADSAFNMIATRWSREELDHLNVPEHLRFVFPIIKNGAAAGLIAGLRWPRIGRLTASALIPYFLAAIAFHLRAGDGPLRYSPAAALLGWSMLAFRSYGIANTSPRDG